MLDIAIRIPKIKRKVATPNASKDEEKLECSNIASENVKLYSHSGQQFVSLLQNYT